MVFITPFHRFGNCRNEINLALNEDKPFWQFIWRNLPYPLDCDYGWVICRQFFNISFLGSISKKVRDALDHCWVRGRKNPLPPRHCNCHHLCQDGIHDAISVTRGRKQTGKKKLQTTSPQLQRAPRKIRTVFWDRRRFNCGDRWIFFWFGDKGESKASFTEGQPRRSSIGLEMNQNREFFKGAAKRKRGEIKMKLSQSCFDTRLFLGKFGVTQEQWKAVLGTSPSKFLVPTDRLNK